MKKDIEVKATAGRVDFSVSRELFNELFEIERNGLVTYEEAAELLRISKAMVHKLVGNGQVKPTKIGHRAFLQRDDVARLAERGTRKKRPAK